MTQNVPSHLEGHIEAPNPLELFWEKNRRIVLFGAIAAVIAIALNYLIQYQMQRARSEHWTALSTATGLDRGSVEPGSSASFLQAQFSQNPQAFVYYAAMTQAELVNDLPEDIKKGSSADLQTLSSGSDVRAPLALWVLANRAYEDGDFEGAKRFANDLKSRFADHFLCRESTYPVQWRADVEKDDAEKEKEPQRADKKPELVAPIAGSAVGEFLGRVQRTEDFRKEHARFYVPTEPTSAETVTFEFENAGQVTIRLFSTQSPKHVERFLALAREQWWKDQRVHEIRREAENSMFGATSPNEFVFGWPSSKGELRSDWKAGDVDPANVVDWEASDLSHFEGTVAVEPAKEGKSQVERIVITGKDVAETNDGTRVIIGRVVEGLDVVHAIIDSAFADEASRQQGRGIPEDNFAIKSVTVK